MCSDGDYEEDEGRSEIDDEEEDSKMPSSQMQSNQIIKKPFADHKVRRSSEARLSCSSVKTKRILSRELKDSLIEARVSAKPKLTSSQSKEYQSKLQPEQQMYLDTHFNNESHIKFTIEETQIQQEGAAQRGGSSLIQLVTERHDETTYQIK